RARSATFRIESAVDAGPKTSATCRTVRTSASRSATGESCPRESLEDQVQDVRRRVHTAAPGAPSPTLGSRLPTPAADCSEQRDRREGSATRATYESARSDGAGGARAGSAGLGAGTTENTRRSPARAEHVTR